MEDDDGVGPKLRTLIVFGICMATIIVAAAAVIAA